MWKEVWLGAYRKRSGSGLAVEASGDKDNGYLSNSPMEKGLRSRAAFILQGKSALGAVFLISTTLE